MDVTKPFYPPKTSTTTPRDVEQWMFHYITQGEGTQEDKDKALDRFCPTLRAEQRERECLDYPKFKGGTVADHNAWIKGMFAHREICKKDHSKTWEYTHESLRPWFD
jgi:hypothetical protein